MRKKEYHGLEFELIGIYGYNEVITSSGQCRYIAKPWYEIFEVEGVQEPCRTFWDYGVGDQNDYSGLWVGSEN